MPLIEAGEQTVDAVRELRRAAARRAGCDTVILGCTHYPLIRPVFQRVFGRDVTLVFSAEETAREVDETLRAQGLGERARAARAPTGSSRPATPPLFRALGERFLQLPLGEVARVSVAELERDRGVTRADGRRPDELRPVVGRSALPRAAARDGALVAGQDAGALHRERRGRRPALALPERARLGDGRVLAAAGLDGERTEREAARGKQGGRTVEIQRLIGRAVRGVIDFEALGERTVHLDCDVLQADGGTRCAAICGAYVALARALDRFGLSQALTGSVAAVSVGRRRRRARCSTSTTPRTRPPTST